MKHQLERAKAVGKAVKEIDSFFKLNAIDPMHCQDRLRGYFGSLDGDWAAAQEKSKSGMQLLNAITKGKVGFREALRTQQQLERDQKSANAIATPYPA